MDEPILLTSDYREARDKRDLALFEDYQKMVALEGQSKTKVNEYLMKKYDLHSVATIYSIRRRVEERLGKEVNV